MVEERQDKLEEKHALEFAEQKYIELELAREERASLQTLIEELHQHHIGNKQQQYRGLGDR
jgi:hypothetical protein